MSKYLKMGHISNAILFKDFILCTKVQPNKVHSTTEVTIITVKIGSTEETLRKTMTNKNALIIVAGNFNLRYWDSLNMKLKPKASYVNSHLNFIELLDADGPWTNKRLEHF